MCGYRCSVHVCLLHDSEEFRFTDFTISILVCFIYHFLWTHIRKIQSGRVRLPVTGNVRLGTTKGREEVRVRGRKGRYG
jgi:hypothetical protein